MIVQVYRHARYAYRAGFDIRGVTSEHDRGYSRQLGRDFSPPYPNRSVLHHTDS